MNDKIIKKLAKYYLNEEYIKADKLLKKTLEIHLKEISELFLKLGYAIRDLEKP